MILDASAVAVLVARAFERAGVEYALGGSVATSIQGEPRSTNDIDFAVRLTERQIPGLVEALGADFDVDELALEEAIRRRRSANIFHSPTVTKIDLFIRGSEPFDESEFSRRVRVEMPAGGGSLFVASIEDNILRKLRWFRMGGEVSDRQWSAGRANSASTICSSALSRGRQRSGPATTSALSTSPSLDGGSPPASVSSRASTGSPSQLVPGVNDRLC